VTVCDNIRLAREQKGFSQLEMARKMDAKRSTYQNWEKNIEPDLITIKRIAQILGIPSYTLLKGVIDFSDAPEQIDTGVHSITIAEEDYQKIKEGVRILNEIFSKAQL